MTQITNYSEKESIANHPKNRKIDFNAHPDLNIYQEIYNCELTGALPNKAQFNANVVMSSLIDFKGTKANFSRADWKDSNFMNCEFHNSIFDYGAIINCQVSNTLFTECKYENMSITGSSFYNVTFINSDLSNMVIEDCQFYDCQFLNCKTSNKLFGLCLLIDTEFKDMEIQIQTITDNWGLIYKQCSNCRIRTKPIEHNFSYIDDIDLFNELDNLELSNNSLNFFKISYFLNGNLFFDGGDKLDDIFDITSWINMSKSKITFLNLFKLFHDFILILFERDKTPLYIIYRLKLITEWICKQPAILNDFDSYPRMIGYDIGLARIISQTDIYIENLAPHYNQTINLLVIGPLNKEFYRDKFSHIIGDDFEIVKVVKQNSPNILEITTKVAPIIIQIIALFVTTRVKTEIIKYQSQKKTKKSKKLKKKNKKANNPYHLINIDNIDNNDLIKLYYSKETNLSINYSQIKSSHLGDIRRIVIDIYE